MDITSPLAVEEVRQSLESKPAEHPTGIIKTAADEAVLAKVAEEMKSENLPFEKAIEAAVDTAIDETSAPSDDDIVKSMIASGVDNGTALDSEIMLSLAMDYASSVRASPMLSEKGRRTRDEMLKMLNESIKESAKLVLLYRRALKEVSEK